MKSINELKLFRAYASSAARFSAALIRSRCALLRPRLRLSGLCVRISLPTCHFAIADRARQAGSVVHSHLLWMIFTLYCFDTRSDIQYVTLQAAMESILAGAICGVVYALFAGQPLTILGSTGPVLVFETITYHFCQWDDDVLTPILYDKTQKLVLVLCTIADLKHPER